MRRRLCLVGLIGVMLVPASGRAQVSMFQTPAPRVTAAGASWQLNSEPLIWGGERYYPTAERVFFDGNVMTQVGTYAGVPFYADTTLEPGSIVYVPVAGSLMRRYERRRAGDLAGTVGSRTPWFPVETPTAPQSEAPAGPPLAAVAPTAAAPSTLAQTPAAQPAPLELRPQRVVIETGVRPEGNRGIWILHADRRWSAVGEAVPYAGDRFQPIGEYHGLPVYRERNGAPNEIFIAASPGGPLTRYQLQRESR